MDRRQLLTLATFSPLIAMAKTKVQTGLVLDDGFLLHQITEAHPEKPARYQAIKQQIDSSDLLSKTVAIKPQKDAEQWLSLIHSQQHITTLKSQSAATHQHALLATAGLLAAVDAVCLGQVNNAFCASRPPGHHALNTGKEEGFCYYNHIAIAARYAQQHYDLNKILIIDWDYHHGNGTEWAFYSDPSVMYFSTHDMFAYPGTGDPDKKGQGKGHGFNINVHLACGAGDDEIIEAFEHYLVPAAEKFQPDLVLISAGFDSRQDDLLGCHTISDQGFSHLTQMVKTIANKHCGGKVISLLEGGYNIEGNANAVVAHINELLR